MTGDEPASAAARELRRGALRARWVLVTMALVAGAATLVSMLVLYDAGISEQRARVVELARSQAELIDAVARFDANESQDANPSGAWVATLQQVADGYARWRREDGSVSLLVVEPRRGGVVAHVRDGQLLAPRSAPLPTGFPAAAIAAALVHESGAFEYRAADGKEWLLVHERIPALGMAVLARLDLDVVKRPFQQGLWISGVASLVLIGLGAALLRKTNVRSIEELRSELSRRVQAEAELARHREDLERIVEERTSELRHAQTQLLAAARLATLGQITAKVSHELRNPLGTIRASLHTLRERTQGQVAGLERIWDRSERNVVRCDRIIEELLSYTRPSAPRRELLNVSDFLSEILEEYRPALPVEVGRDIQLGVVHLIDADDLRRMLINLLNNAVDALDAGRAQSPGAPPVRLCLQQDAEAVTISVEDHGEGMADDVLSRAFEPLFSTKGFGIGLGLPIVRELAERNGGSIELSSRQGQGTRAVLRFPRLGVGEPG